MSKSYDLNHELKNSIQEALDALMNAPNIGSKYDQQHSDTHIKAYLRLKTALDDLKKYGAPTVVL